MADRPQQGARDLLRDHLLRVIAVLSAFLLASVAVIVSDAPLWSKGLAAALALIGLSLVALWLPLTWSDWRARRGLRIACVAIPLAAAVLVIGLGLSVWKPGPSRVADDPATLLLLDASETMAAPLSGGATKFEEARRRLGHELRIGENDQLGLATFGVEGCDEEDPVDEIVSIGPSGADRIRERATDLSPAGRANLVSAARYGVGLLNGFRGSRSVVVITGGLDRCGGDLGELLSEHTVKGVPIRWELVGLGLSADEKERVKQLPAGVAVHLADTSDELNDVLDLVLFEKPIRDEFEELRGYVESTVREPLNDAVGAVNSQPPETVLASTRLRQVRDLAKEGERRFDEFGATKGACDFAQVESLLALQFRRLTTGADALERVVAFDRRHPGGRTNDEIEERNGLIADANGPIGEYNANLPELAKVIESALNRCFGA
jgi:hypothetical protein